MGVQQQSGRAREDNDVLVDYPRRRGTGGERWVNADVSLLLGCRRQRAEHGCEHRPCGAVYRDINILRYAAPPETVNPTDPAFKESNKMHTINGLMYCNLKGLSVRQGQRVRWYMHSVGSDHGMHTPRWFGNSVTEYGHRRGVLELLPGESRVVDMLADNPGRWLFHCEVHDHATAGMKAFFQVTNNLHYWKKAQGPQFRQWARKIGE